MITDLTIVTPTSAIPTHPSTEIITESLASLVAHAGLEGCRHLIVCDGLPETDRRTSAAYAEYRRRLRRLSDRKALGTDSEIVELTSPVGQGGAVLAAHERLRTPYLLHYEHDWRLTRRLDTEGVLALFDRWEDVNYVRLNLRRNVEAGADSVLKPDGVARETPLVRTCNWSGNPHFARTAHYRETVLPHVFAQAGDAYRGFEQAVYRRYLRDIIRDGFDRAGSRWGVFILGELGAEPYVEHIDGRETVPAQGASVGVPKPRRDFFNFDFQARFLARAASTRGEVRSPEGPGAPDDASFGARS